MNIAIPSATLIGLMMPVDEFSGVEPEQLIEAAGRTCYKSEDAVTPDSYKPFIDKVCNQLHHESVMEHSGASFRIVCDRGVSHELVRHRLASYSQESTRYCNYGKDKFGGEITVIEPPGLNLATKSVWRTACKDAESNYLAMLAHGMSPQIARSVLPTCLKTEIVMTANFREWKHFLKLRLAPAAHPQMREIAELIRERLVLAAPTVFAEFLPKENAK